MGNQEKQSCFEFDFKERSLKGRTVLVAGGTGGLGSAAVTLLIKNGATVVAGYRSNQARARSFEAFIRSHYGSELHLVEGDIATAQARKQYIEQADALGEGLYGLVCFTGDPARVKFDEASESDLLASLRENYLAAVLLAREAATRMIKRKISGSIVLISSMQAVGVFESSLNYAAPKATLIHAARVLAKQWGGPDGLRVNVIAPGVNEAGMAKASIASGKYDFYLEEKVIPRFGRPEDVARVVRLFLEPDNYITGQLITVDGGLTLRRPLG